MGKKCKKLKKRNKELNDEINDLRFIIFCLLISNMRRNSIPVEPSRNIKVWFPNGDKWEC